MNDAELLKRYEQYMTLSAKDKEALKRKAKANPAERDTMEIIELMERDEAKRRYHELGKQKNSKQTRAPIRRQGGSIRVL